MQPALLLRAGQQREWRGPVSKLRAWAGRERMPDTQALSLVCIGQAPHGAGRGRLLPSSTAPLAGNTPRPEGDLQSADLIPVSHTLTSNSTPEKHQATGCPRLGRGWMERVGKTESGDSRQADSHSG